MPLSKREAIKQFNSYKRRPSSKRLSTKRKSSKRSSVPKKPLPQIPKKLIPKKPLPKIPQKVRFTEEELRQGEFALNSYPKLYPYENIFKPIGSVYSYLKDKFVGPNKALPQLPPPKKPIPQLPTKPLPKLPPKKSIMDYVEEEFYSASEGEEEEKKKPELGKRGYLGTIFYGPYENEKKIFERNKKDEKERQRKVMNEILKAELEERMENEKIKYAGPIQEVVDIAGAVKGAVSNTISVIGGVKRGAQSVDETLSEAVGGSYLNSIPSKIGKKVLSSANYVMSGGVEDLTEQQEQAEFELSMAEEAMRRKKKNKKTSSIFKPNSAGGIIELYNDEESD